MGGAVDISGNTAFGTLQTLVPFKVDAVKLSHCYRLSTEQDIDVRDICNARLDAKPVTKTALCADSFDPIDQASVRNAPNYGRVRRTPWETKETDVSGEQVTSKAGYCDCLECFRLQLGPSSLVITV